MHFRDLAQAGAHGKVVRVDHAAVLDEQRQVAVAVLVVHPAVPVAVVVEFKRPRLAKRVAEPALDLASKPVQPAILNGVLEPGVFAVGTIAVIPLGGDDFLSHVCHLFGRVKTKHVGQTREGLGLPMVHAHATANGDGVANDLVVLNHRDEAKVVREQVDIVARRHGQGGFEFPWQVGFAVDRFLFRLGVGGDFLFLAVFVLEPNLVIRPCGRGEMGTDGPRHLQRLGVQPGLVRVRVAHDVAVDVATSRDGVHQRVVDLANGELEIFLDDTVQLKCLPRGQLERAVGVVGAKRVHVQPLLRGADPAGQTDTGHEGIRRLELGLAAFASDVAVVLLVNAMKLGELRVVRRQRTGRLVKQPLGNRATQEFAGLLDGLVFRQLRLVAAVVLQCHRQWKPGRIGGRKGRCPSGLEKSNRAWPSGSRKT